MSAIGERAGAKGVAVRFVPFEQFDRLVRRLRKLVRRGTDAQRRDALALVLGLHGLRVTETRNLNVGDLDRIDQTLTVRTLKRGRPRRVRLGAGVFRALRKLAGKRAAAEPLFTTGKGRRVSATQWHRFARETTAAVLGGRGLRYHAGRHTFAVRFYHRTRDVVRLQARLGHRSIKNTQVYVEAYGELDERRLGRWPAETFEELPELEPRREREGPRNRKRGAAPKGGSAGRVIRREPKGKTGENLGNRNDFQGLRAGKTVPGAKRRTKTTSRAPERISFAEWKALLEKDLAAAAEAARRSG